MAFRDAHSANLAISFNEGQLPQNEIISPYAVLRVGRENIVQDTLSQAITLGPMEHKKPLQVPLEIVKFFCEGLGK